MWWLIYDLFPTDFRHLISILGFSVTSICCFDFTRADAGAINSDLPTTASENPLMNFGNSMTFCTVRTTKVWNAVRKKVSKGLQLTDSIPLIRFCTVSLTYTGIPATPMVQRIWSLARDATEAASMFAGRSFLYILPKPVHNGVLRYSSPPVVNVACFSTSVWTQVVCHFFDEIDGGKIQDIQVSKRSRHAYFKYHYSTRLARQVEVDGNHAFRWHDGYYLLTTLWDQL